MLCPLCGETIPENSINDLNNYKKIGDESEVTVEDLENLLENKGESNIVFVCPHCNKELEVSNNDNSKDNKKNNIKLENDYSFGGFGQNNNLDEELLSDKSDEEIENDSSDVSINYDAIIVSKYNCTSIISLLNTLSDRISLFDYFDLPLDGNESKIEIALDRVKKIIEEISSMLSDLLNLEDMIRNIDPNYDLYVLDMLNNLDAENSEDLFGYTMSETDKALLLENIKSEIQENPDKFKKYGINYDELMNFLDSSIEFRVYKSILEINGKDTATIEEQMAIDKWYGRIKDINNLDSTSITQLQLLTFGLLTYYKMDNSKTDEEYDEYKNMYEETIINIQKKLEDDKAEADKNSRGLTMSERREKYDNGDFLSVYNLDDINDAYKYFANKCLNDLINKQSQINKDVDKIGKELERIEEYTKKTIAEEERKKVEEEFKNADPETREKILEAKVSARLEVVLKSDTNYQGLLKQIGDLSSDFGNLETNVEYFEGLKDALTMKSSMFKYNAKNPVADYKIERQGYYEDGIYIRDDIKITFYDENGNEIKPDSLQVALFFKENNLKMPSIDINLSKKDKEFLYEVRDFFQNYNGSEDDIKLLYYYEATEREYAKYKINKAIDETLRKEGLERAQKIIDKVENADTTLEKSLILDWYGIGNGLTSWWDGMKNLFYADGRVSANEYKSMFIAEHINEKYSTLDSIILNLSYEIFTSIGNMVPAIAATTVFAAATGGLGLPVIAVKASQFLLSYAFMGLSATGSSYEQGMQSGLDRDTARLYGFISGASEVIMERILGAMPGLSDMEKFKNFPGITGFIMKGLSEGLEESVQELSDPAFMMIANVLTGHEAGFDSEGFLNRIDEYFTEIVDWKAFIKSGIYGFITGAIMNAPTLAIETASQLKTGDPRTFTYMLSYLASKYRNADLSLKEVFDSVKSDYDNISKLGIKINELKAELASNEQIKENFNKYNESAKEKIDFDNYISNIALETYTRILENANENNLVPDKINEINEQIEKINADIESYNALIEQSEETINNNESTKESQIEADADIAEYKSSIDKLTQEKEFLIYVLQTPNYLTTNIDYNKVATEIAKLLYNSNIESKESAWEKVKKYFKDKLLPTKEETIIEEITTEDTTAKDTTAKDTTTEDTTAKDTTAKDTTTEDTTAKDTTTEDTTVEETAIGERVDNNDVIAEEQNVDKFDTTLEMPVLSDDIINNRNIAEKATTEETTTEETNVNVANAVKVEDKLEFNDDNYTKSNRLYNNVIKKLISNLSENQVSLSEYRKYSSFEVVESEMKFLNKHNLYQNSFIEHDQAHVMGVLQNALYIGNKLGLSKMQQQLLIKAASLHDCGASFNSHSNHGINAMPIIKQVLSNEGIFTSEQIDIIAAVVGMHDISDSKLFIVDKDGRTVGYTQRFTQLCGNINIDNYYTVELLLKIIKDADALERTRFADFGKEGLDVSRLRLSPSIEIIEVASYLSEKAAIMKINQILNFNIGRIKSIVDNMIEKGYSYREILLMFEYPQYAQRFNISFSNEIFMAIRRVLASVDYTNNTSSSSKKYSAELKDTIDNILNQGKDYLAQLENNSIDLKEQKKDYKLMERSSGHASEEVAIMFGDSRQYLVSIAEALYNSNSLSDQDRIILKNTIYRPTFNIDERALLNNLYKYMTSEQKQKYNEILENAPSYTSAEKELIFIYTKHLGPNFTAYIRQKIQSFSDVKYDGTDIDSTYYDIISLIEGYGLDAIGKIFGGNLLDVHDTRTKAKILDSLIGMIDEIIEKAPKTKEDIIVLRGVDSLYLNNGKITSFEVGTRFNDTGFVSTSATRSYISESHKILLEIEFPKGSKGAYIDTYTGAGMYGQQEILLPRNTTFEIIDVPKEGPDGKKIIRCKIVENANNKGDKYSRINMEILNNSMNQLSHEIKKGTDWYHVTAYSITGDAKYLNNYYIDLIDKLNLSRKKILEWLEMNGNSAYIEQVMNYIIKNKNNID